ncbi:MAG TPA: hypothetical protein VI876_01370 [Dehalococcoidia bacterium]|nr:hypothetical protein [Dehalococcoidia bacterium]
MKTQLLWFQGCPSHEEARLQLRRVLAEAGVGDRFDDIDATDPSVARELRFSGSPTIRVNGVDIEPGFADPGDYTPRCRLYSTEQGLRGLPKREWIEAGLGRSAAE